MNDQAKIIVSVIIPSYNSGEYLRAAIDSALNQTFKALEVIVVDDGSTDNTVDIASSYGDKVILHQQENAGAAEARNSGAKIASGEWLAFLDADDIWDPVKIEKQLEHCGNYTWSHTDSVFIGFEQDGTVRCSDRCPKHGGNVLPMLIVNNSVSTSTVMVKREAFFEVGGFDKSLRALQDWDLWLKLAAKHELGYLPESFTQYMVHSGSTSRSPRKTLPYHIKIINRTFAPDGVGAAYPHLRRGALSDSYSILSHIAEESLDPIIALNCAVKAAWYRPNDLYLWKCIARIILKGFPDALRNKNNQ